MKQILFNLLSKARQLVVLNINPEKGYFLATRNLSPLSSKFGFDRGTPIDRFWIEKFLRQNKQSIHGHVLEVTDNKYSKMFGENKVSQVDVLDIDKKNKKANIIGDLRNLKNINDNVYDTVILTHVLGLIDEIDSAISECYRIIKPGGTILVTSSCFSPTYDDTNFWRFTAKSMKFIFGKKFNPNKIKVSTFGNVLTGQCFWVGMAQEELTQKELNFDDPKFPCIIGVVATK